MALLQVVARLRLRLRVVRGRSFALPPCTVIVFNHQSDLDVPAMVTAAFPLASWPRHGGRVIFPGRSELFLPGFLALQSGAPDPIGRALFGVSIGPILARLGVFSVAKAGPRLFAAWVDDLTLACGPYRQIAALFAVDWLYRLRRGGIDSTTPIGAISSWHYRALLRHEVGSEILHQRVSRHLRLRTGRAASAQFDAMAALLRDGYLLVMAPEGQLSPDGRLQPFASGLHQLLRRAPQTAVLPAGLYYGTGGVRRTATVRFGPLLHGLAALPRQQCEAELSRWLRSLSRPG
ncbi:MAG TPA: hypothetical protein VH916_03230 [Dehalococcoidia bacterium]